MKLDRLALGALVAGLVLIACSYAIPAYWGGARSLTDEQAQQYNEAFARLHAMTSVQSDDPQHQADLKAAQEQLDQRRRELAASEARTRLLARVLWILGCVITAAGLGVFFVTRSSVYD